jgi:hypothetical protein
MSFKTNKYVVIKQAISKELAAFVANYFSIKKQVYILVDKKDLFLPLKYY